MTDNVAVLEGFTQEVRAVHHAGAVLHLLVKPDSWKSSKFKAWDMDSQIFMVIEGWNFAISPTDPNVTV